MTPSAINDFKYNFVHENGMSFTMADKMMLNICRVKILYMS